MKGDITKIVAELQNNCFLNWRINNTFLVLLPKKEGEKRVEDFRRISLLHGVYKIIAKTLANKLSLVIAMIILGVESVAVKGRNIHDCILIANELVDSRIRGKKADMLMKLDFYKAFDSVLWRYLNYMLDRCRF